jgi:hypothetical protein
MRYLILGIFILSFSGCQQDTVNTPPPTYTLSQNFPNPFTDTTVVNYGIPSVSGTGPWIRIVVNDRFNQTMATLVNTHNHSAGTFSVTWNGRRSNFEKVPAGIYYIELQRMDSHGGDDDKTVYDRKIALKQ